MLESAVEIRRPGRSRSDFNGLDPAVTCPAQLAWAYWLQGRVDAALEQANDAVATARRNASPFDLAMALLFLGTTHLLRGEYTLAECVCDEAMAVATDHGLPYWRGGMMMCQGSAIALRGTPARGVELLQKGLSTWERLSMETGAVGRGAARARRARCGARSTRVRHGAGGDERRALVGGGTVSPSRRAIARDGQVVEDRRGGAGGRSRRRAEGRAIARAASSDRSGRALGRESPARGDRGFREGGATADLVEADRVIGELGAANAARLGGARR